MTEPSTTVTGLTPTTDVVCHYHEEVKAPLLRDAVLPLAERLRGAGLSVHLERHWLHGPHVRLRLRGPEAHRAAAAADAADRLRAHLAVAPSRAGLDEELLLRRSEAAGRAELVPPPYDPIQPDNTVLVTDGDQGALVALLGTAGAVECRADVLAAGLAPVRMSLDQLALVGDAPAARVGVVVTAMAAHADTWPGRLLSGYHTFLSHLEDFLFGERDELLRPRFAAFAERAGGRYHDLVRQAATPDTTEPVAAAWRAWSAAAWRIAERAYDAGALNGAFSAEFRRRTTSFDDATAIRWDLSRRGASAYHQALEASGFQRTAASREFQIYRFCTNMLYQLLTLCDVAPLERYLGAHLLAEATQEIHGVSWQDALTARTG
ncbi:lantibiotic dehydratase C-terminal domain-containing protein [Micromonospora echinofusca]|uniref:lantibiotic dehydratase C-terminal domain-containing protein n=1 Tax=Micromonospora echinofusca TaxID=47858 RepID=UPI0033CBE420